MTDYTPRKRPQQARSQATFDAIVEAGAQLLVDDGFHHINTNTIAERAGVSIGSLYQYFPNKESVVAAVVEQFADRQFEILAAGVTDVAQKPLDEAIRRVIGALLDAKKAEPELSRVLFGQLPPLGQINIVRDWTRRACEVVGAALAARDDLDGPPDLDMAAFILVTACHGVVHTTVIDRPEWLADDQLAAETTRLVLNYLHDKSFN